MILLLGILTLLFQNPPEFKNLDFEQGELGKHPPGWLVNLAGGYRAYLDDKGVKEGKHCLVLEQSVKELVNRGSIWQMRRAKPFRGKRLVFRSFVRTEPQIGSNQAWLFVEVFGKDNESVLFSHDNHKIRSNEWIEYELAADISNDAKEIKFGLALEGSGRAYWDDVRVEVLDATGFGDEPPRPLERRALENVVAFARLLGYLRYFYPGDETANKVNWENFAIDGIRAVEKALDAEELIAILENRVRPVAPAVRIFPLTFAEEAKASFSLPREGAIGKVYWRHHGVEGQGRGANVYRSNRIHAFFDRDQVDEGSPNPEEPYFADLGGGVGCLIPLALYEKETGSLPHNWNALPLKSSPRAPGFLPSGNDRATRLANVALAWNVFQHFYPYFDVVETDWTAVLPEYLQTAATDPDELAFLQTLRRMIAELHDGHGWVSFAEEPSMYVPPIAWDWIEEKLVITVVSDGSQEIKVGDIALTVDGVSIAEALRKTEGCVSSATPQWSRWRALEFLRQGERDSVLRLKLQDSGDASREISLIRTIPVGSTKANSITETRPDKTASVAPGILYVDIDRVTDDEFEKFLPEMEKAKGIIFDLRGYPHRLSVVGFLQHLFDRRFHVLQAFVPITQFPDRARFSFTEDLNTRLDPIEPHLKANIVFLTDGRAISAAETILQSVEFHKRAVIVGGPTAGTNGVVNEFRLPGGYGINWTGMRILKPDGSRHHGVGVLPTVPTFRTIAGVTEGRDELLERAIMILSE